MARACYVYAIMGARELVLPALKGFEGATLSCIQRGSLAAAVSPLEGELPRTVEHVLQHEAIVEALRQVGPVLPVRFGTILRDVDAVAGTLEAQEAVLAADLARLGDTCEFGLTALWEGSGSEKEALDDRDASQSGTGETQGRGTRYLQGRLIGHRREALAREKAAALARDLDGVLGAAARDARYVPLAGPRLALRASYLLEPAAVGAFQHAFEQARAAHRDVRLLLSGPWPPYSFVSPPQPAAQAATSQAAVAAGGEDTAAKSAPAAVETLNTRS